ncbi:hypothetical protein [Trueperella bialowiezensis]|uniref:hypothetical protein n=1 Tax=Trueperella bialowiezensis TaxID=312285 RepID=UPI000F84525B|nr:hypothetical protein [Trueperella bialowiezensis]
MEVVESALKHGVHPDDIEHAYRNAIFVHFEDGYQMIVGPSRSGLMLEIALNNSNQIFHAMKARPKYLRK